MFKFFKLTKSVFYRCKAKLNRSMKTCPSNKEFSSTPTHKINTKLLYKVKKCNKPT